MKHKLAVISMSLAAALFAASVSAQQKTEGRTCCGPGITPGWKLMTPEERTQHRQKMLSLKTYDECKAYVEEHHNQMVGRAKEKGLAMPETPRGHPCDRMKARGQIN
jgi:hypothetical protein